MAREIDILLKAARKRCAVLDKASHVLWDCEELARAREAGCYPDDDWLAPPTKQVEVSGPFPGCLQQYAAAADFSSYSLVGQTEHFLIFAPPAAPAGGGAGGSNLP
jgi:hypothetical protein